MGEGDSRQGARGDAGIVGNKQRDFGKEKVRGKPTRECPTDGRAEEEEGEHQV